MRPKARFIRSVINAAQECDTVMPWVRSARRTHSKGANAPRQVRTA